MIAPDQRTVYTDALRPPPGYRLDRAVGTTYSLDLTSLIGLPVQLALLAADADVEELLRDGLALLEALRRTADRLAVFCDRGQIREPRIPAALYALLEPVVVEARARLDPKAAFHPKLWLLRFTPHEDSDDADPLFRLVIPSRNLTADRCWDLCLTLEGRLRGRNRSENRSLVELISALPELAVRAIDPARLEWIRALAAEVGRVEWEVPEPFDELRFITLGLRDRRWKHWQSRKLAVISPFLSAQTLEDFCDSTDQPSTLVSRPEELADVPGHVLERFERVLVLNESAEREDGEDNTPSAWPTHGLHAKALAMEYDRHLCLYVGSANATSAALSGGGNVEIMAELVGRRSQTGSIADILGAEGFGALLNDYTPDDEAPDTEGRLAEDLLRDVREAFRDAKLILRCGPSAGGDISVVLVAEHPFELNAMCALRIWPASTLSAHAVDGMALPAGTPVPLGTFDIANVTSFIALEVSVKAGELEMSEAFVLQVPIEGLDSAARDLAIVRSLIRNRDGFLRYLLLLLAELGLPGVEIPPVVGLGSGRNGSFGADPDSLPLLEELTRALCRDPDRLHAIRRLIRDLSAGETEDLVPADFTELWASFEAVLAERGA